MIRTKGEAGTGNVVEAVRHARAVQGAIRQLQTMDDDELYVYAKVGAALAPAGGDALHKIYLVSWMSQRAVCAGSRQGSGSVKAVLT
jgi:pyridoxal biosynthesis lyase PdxS